jgi:alanyl-tRNA synthetase
MKSKQLRSVFLDYFSSNNHALIEGSPIVPSDDATLLFTNAGMNQFKNIFLGTETPSYTRATTAQRCIRAGGKHNDLSQVGFTKRHLTCFEMLGNFSFGDYFKEDAIVFAWELLTKHLCFNKDSLWATVFNNDDEAYHIWHTVIGLPKNKIVRLGEKDNFWQMGDVGPCGPCSEIYFDRGIFQEVDKHALPGDDNSIRFLEIWNLVFMQFNKNSTGQLESLNKKGVDTGMGLERLASVVQNVDTVFDIDAFAIIINEIKNHIKNKDLHDAVIQTSSRVIADHIRSSCCIMSEGIVPSNEGRGYVLRKILRRALLFAHKLGNPSIVYDIIPYFLSNEEALFSDLKKNISFIQNNIREEQERFITNLDLGTKKFYDMMKNQTSQNIFSGKDTFLLYDTYGFPIEAIEVLARENKREIDYENYELHMNEQKKRSQKTGNFKINTDSIIIPETIKTNFIGYDVLSQKSSIIGIISNNELVQEVAEGAVCFVAAKETPFYSSSGGQVSDCGFVEIQNKKSDVLNVIKINNGIFLEIIAPCQIKNNCEIIQVVNKKTRSLTSFHHTGVHVLQAALRNVFGDSIKQAGSQVTSNYATLDVTLSIIPSGDEILQIQQYINQLIFEDIVIKTNYMTYDEAISRGALAFFTDKYDKKNVRMVEVGSISKELCGGTHAQTTSQLGIFLITDVSGVASGIKRFTFKVSQSAYEDISVFHKTIQCAQNIYKCEVHTLCDSFNQGALKLQQSYKIIENLEMQLLQKSYELWKNTSLHCIKKYGYGAFELDENQKKHAHALARIMQKNLDGIYCLYCKEKDSMYVYVTISDSLLNNNISEIILSSLTGDNNQLFKGKKNTSMIIGTIFKTITVKDFIDAIESVLK